MVSKPASNSDILMHCLCALTKGILNDMKGTHTIGTFIKLLADVLLYTKLLILYPLAWMNIMPPYNTAHFSFVFGKDI